MKRAANVWRQWSRIDRFILFNFAMAAVILLGIGYAGYAEYRDELGNLLGEVQSIAITLNQASVPSRFGDTPQEKQAESYKQLSSIVGQFDRVPVGNIDSVFLLGQRDDGSIFFYVGSGDKSGPNQSSFGNTYTEASKNIKQVFTTGQAASFVEHNQWGSWMTGAAPIKLTNGSTAGVLTVYSSESQAIIGIFYRVILPGLLALLGIILLLIVLQRSNRRQQAISYQRSVFLTTTSHDIRSPLRGILWALDLMKNPKADREVLIAKMEVQLKYVIDLVESVLATVRTDFALRQFRKKDQDIIPILSKAVESQSLSAEQYGVTIHMDMPAHLQARVDENLVAEIANNLLSNAIKYTKPNSNIIIKAWQRDSSVWFSVSDEGEGMTPDEQARLFGAFYRTESAKMSGRPGTGMGLTLVKDMVSRHKGGITVKSKLHEGSTFTVRLPK